MPGNRAGVGHGRPPKERERAILDAIANAFAPEEITLALREALKIAWEQKSARGMVSVLEVAAHYGVGKPVQRADLVGDDELTSILAQLRGSDAGKAGDANDH